MIKENHIKKLVEERLKGSDKFLVDIRIKPGNLILVFIDSDTSVSIDDCASLNRFIESKLDRDTEDFELRVSSSGLDHPLQLLRQYRKNIGRLIEVITIDGLKKRGILLKADEKMIEMELIHENSKKKKQSAVTKVAVTFSDIKETKQVISFR